MRGGEIARQPGKHEIESVGVGGEAEGESPDSALPQQIGERRSLSCAGPVFRLGTATSDVLTLGGSEELVFAGIAVEGVEQREEKDADHASGGKIPAPPEMQEHNTQYWYADGRGKFCHGVEHRGCQAALVLGEPVAGGFRVGGKGWRLADP